MSQVLFSVGARDESLYIMIFRVIMQYVRTPAKVVYQVATGSSRVTIKRESCCFEVVNLTMGLIGAFGVLLRAQIGILNRTS